MYVCGYVGRYVHLPTYLPTHQDETASAGQVSGPVGGLDRDEEEGVRAGGGLGR